VLNAGSENLQVRVGGQFNSVEELRRFPSAPSTRPPAWPACLRLGDIAEVRATTVDPPAVKVRHQGQDVIALGVSMAKGGDIIAWARRWRRRGTLQADLPAGITLAQVQDQPRAVARSVGEFVQAC
jgi:multidrug efflux pump